MALNDKQARFVAEYLKDPNATQAAIRAGYSPKTAYAQGCRLLKHAEVQQKLAVKTEKMMGKLEISAERVLAERARLAFLDPRKLFDENGRPLSVHQLDPDTAAAVAGFEYEHIATSEGIVSRVAKLKLADKNASLTALEKHLGLYKDDAGNGSPLHIHLHLGD
ncbi:terminase small subunit [Mycobacterium tuberculosis]|uniref:terminase small subunit n=1 Tax=Ralstonia sp. CP TaxID=3231757 RepID=UPI0012482816